MTKLLVPASSHKRLKLLVPASSHKLRISDELAERLEAGGGGGATSTCTALVVNSFGKIWHVDVGRDGDGAFLGRGWPEFVSAHGIGADWLLVLRHEGRCVLTVKAFNTTGCLNEFGRSLTVAATQSSIGGARRPQFILVLDRSFVRKMPIPAEFVQRYVSEEQLSNNMAIVSIPLSKHCRIELEKDRSDVFFARGWSQFLEFHGITERDDLLLKYEGNMVFTVQVFGPNGYQMEFKDRVGGHDHIEKGEETKIEREQEAPSSSRKRECNYETPSAKDKKGQKSSKTLEKELSPMLNRCVYEIGPPAWIKKEINSNSLERHIALTSSFCNAIGFREHCTITLKTSMDSTRSWQVHGLVYSGASLHQLGQGWKNFCQDNRIKEGDWCTFNIVEPTLWHVVIVETIE